jgi:hypothetical protein
MDEATMEKCRAAALEHFELERSVPEPSPT